MELPGTMWTNYKSDDMHLKKFFEKFYLLFKNMIQRLRISHMIISEHPGSGCYLAELPMVHGA